MAMSLFAKLRSLVRNITRKSQVERELSDEIASYVAMATDAKIKEGLKEYEARRAALIELGGAEQVKEAVRETRFGYRLDAFFQDLRFAVRSLRKAPAFSLTVSLVLALGIGSTTLMFAIVNAVLLEGPRFPEANRLITLWQRIPQEQRMSFSPKEFAAWKKQTQVFEDLSYVTGTGFTISGRGDPELVVGRMVAPTFFQLLRVNPALGRAFGETETNEHVVLLTDDLWREKFGARPDVVGESITMNGEPYTVIGVLGEDFQFDGGDAKLFVPAVLTHPVFVQHPDAHFLRVVGRLKPGITRQQLDAEVSLLATRVDDPDQASGRRYFELSLRELNAGELRTPLLVLMCAVSLLLLIACANVANLTLARNTARQGEMTIRSALGASRSRMVGQLVMESAVLAGVGSLVGFAIAMWGLGLLRYFATQHIPELLGTHIGLGIFFFAFAVSAAVGCIFGIAPAFSASKLGFQAGLKGTTRATSGVDRSKQALVMAEVAIAAVLVIGCALMMRSFAALTQVDPGFRAANVVTANIGLTKDRFPDKPKMLQFHRTALEQIRNLPGAERVGMVTHLPFAGNSWGNGFDIEGQMTRSGGEYSAQIRSVSPGYFGALGIPLKEGTDFTDRNNENTPGVAIVNELLAKRFWPNTSPIGKRIRYFEEWLVVVGVCGNIKHARLDGEPDMEIYVPYLQLPQQVMQFVGRDLNYVIRSDRPGAIAVEVRTAIRALDPDAVVKVTTMEALIRESIAQPRMRTWLIAIFAVSAVALSCLGIYGLIAYLVTQRYREIGIRIALGATRANIVQLILSRTLRLTAAGIGLGVVAAFFLSYFLASVLFGVEIHDPLSFIAVPMALIGAALLAGYLPARRATHIDPVTSLRYE